MSPTTKAKRRQLRADERAAAYTQGREVGRLEGKVDAYATVALAGLGLLGRLLDLGERVEVARATAPIGVAVPILRCGSRPHNTPIDHRCDRPVNHTGKHEASGGRWPEWESCGARTTRAPFECFGAICEEPKGHLGDHRDRSGGAWIG